MPASHIKGKWGLCATMSSNFQSIRHVTDEEANILADVRYVKGFTQEEVLANARLIAAAPELLDALQQVMAPIAGCESDPRYVAARAVLKKLEV